MKHLLFLFVIGLAGCQSAPISTVLPVPAKPVAPSPPPPAQPAAAPAPASADLEQKIRQQAQYIEALISQNDALTAKLAAADMASASPANVTPLPPPLTPLLSDAPSSEPTPLQSEPAPLQSEPTSLSPEPSPLSPEPKPLPRPAALPPPAPPLLPAALPPNLPPALPPEPTLTPNADNVIDLVAVVVAERPGEPVNPFTVRTVPPEATREVTLHVGGIISGPITCAVINDRLVQIGDTIESLAVERIDAGAVLLRHSGRLLRLPIAAKSIRVRLPL